MARIVLNIEKTIPQALLLVKLVLYYIYFSPSSMATLNPLPPNRRRGKKILVVTFISLFSAIILIFVFFFIYYLWQFKYGSLEKKTASAKQFMSAQFTFADKRTGDGPRVPGSIREYIRDHNASWGNKTAKVTVLAFVDFACPFSQKGYPLFENIKEKYGPAAQVVLKYLPLTVIHPTAMDAANASACANAQGKFWEYYDKLFTIKKFDNAALQQYAAELNLDEKKFARCLTAKQYQKDIDQDVLDAATLGVRGTPTYFVNQTPIEGVVDMKTWDSIILNNLK